MQLIAFRLGVLVTFHQDTTCTNESSTHTDTYTYTHPHTHNHTHTHTTHTHTHTRTHTTVDSKRRNSMSCISYKCKKIRLMIYFDILNQMAPLKVVLHE